MLNIIFDIQIDAACDRVTIIGVAKRAETLIQFFTRAHRPPDRLHDGI